MFSPTKSAFKIRGVVEGFYGKPWTHQQRLAAVGWFAKFGMNTYLIAPKDDPVQRFNWKEPLSPAKAQQLGELIALGNQLGVEVSMSVSPGISVEYSSTADRAAAIARFQQQLELGATSFALLWDDIDWELQHQSDRTKYKHIEHAQAEFSNEIYSTLTLSNPEIKFSVCPMIYSGRGHSKHLKELGRKLHPKIKLMWTGRQIRSEYLDAIDAEVFEKDAKRKPLYWDNFPVNNLSLRFELHVGPVVGRESSLSKHAVGLLSNPMLQFHCSLLPLATVAAYLNDPNHYEPNAAWEAALELLYPNLDDRAALRTVFRCFMSSPIDSDAAPDLRAVLGRATALRRSQQIAESQQAIQAYANDLQVALSHVQSQAFGYPEVAAEIAPWVPKLEKGLLLLNALAASNSVEIQSALSEFEQIRQVAFGDLLDGAAAEYLAESAIS